MGVRWRSSAILSLGHDLIRPGPSHLPRRMNTAADTQSSSVLFSGKHKGRAALAVRLAMITDTSNCMFFTFRRTADARTPRRQHVPRSDPGSTQIVERMEREEALSRDKPAQAVVCARPGGARQQALSGSAENQRSAVRRSARSTDAAIMLRLSCVACILQHRNDGREQPASDDRDEQWGLSQKALFCSAIQTKGMPVSAAEERKGAAVQQGGTIY